VPSWLGKCSQQDEFDKIIDEVLEYPVQEVGNMDDEEVVC
jgi:hypothetical protein